MALTDNIIIGYNNAVDGVDFTGTVSAYSFLPVSNLKNIGRFDTFKCNANQVIVGNFSAAQLLSMVALWRPTLSGTWSITLYSGANQSGSTVYTQSGITEPDHFFNEVTALSFRLVFAGSGVFELGRLYFGQYFQPQYNFNVGAQFMRKDMSQQSRTDGGSLRIRSGAKFRAFEFDLDMLDDTDRDKFSEIYELSGLDKDIYISGAPNGTARLKSDLRMFAVFKNETGYTLAYTFLANSKLSIEEL